MIYVDWQRVLEAPTSTEDRDRISDAAECALLGSVMIAGSLTPKMRKLKPTAFRHPDRARVWDAILSMDAEGYPIDPITISWQTNAPSVVVGYMVELESMVPDVENRDAYADIVREAAFERTHSNRPARYAS